jgi:hypothetical protein
MPRAPLWIALAIAVAAGVAWLIYQLWPMIQRSNGVASEVPAVTAPTPAAQPTSTLAPQPTSTLAPQPTSTSAPQLTPTPTASAPPAVAATTPNEVRVRLEFSEPSWAEIYDSTGKRLMFDMGTPGRVRTVAGSPPLRINLGLASAVSAQVDDKPIVIPRRAGKDGAKFLIEADGSVNPDSLQTAERE